MKELHLGLMYTIHNNWFPTSKLSKKEIIVWCFGGSIWITDTFVFRNFKWNTNKSSYKVDPFYDDINGDFLNVATLRLIDLEQIQWMPQIFTYIKQNNLCITFPILEIALRIFLTLPNTNRCWKRIFLQTRAKNTKRFTFPIFHTESSAL